jgi:hypothetical protein
MPRDQIRRLALTASTSSSRSRRARTQSSISPSSPPLGTIAIYANDGGVAVHPDVRRNMGLNARYQFVLLYTLGWDRIAAAVTTSTPPSSTALPRRRAVGPAAPPLHSRTTQPRRIGPSRAMPSARADQRGTPISLLQDAGGCAVIASARKLRPAAVGDVDDAVVVRLQATSDSLRGRCVLGKEPWPDRA